MERIKVKQLNPHIYLMDDAGESTGYVVVGGKKALIIDTMNGYEDVKAVARRITDLPLMVINTHGHCDHIGGNIYFEETYLHPLDREVAEQHMKLPGFVQLLVEKNLSMPPFRDIQGGDRIDLGGLTVEVIHLPGHTPGSILLLLKEDRVLFTGDAINRHLWLQLEESLSPQEYLEKLEQVMYLTDAADYILHGHIQDFMPISFLKEFRRGVQEVREGKNQEDSDYTWFGGLARQHPYDDGKAVIVYPREWEAVK